MVSSSKESIKITSLYIKENIVSKMISLKKDKVNISLIISFKLMNYYVEVSDLEALNKIILYIGRKHKKLSKIYLPKIDFENKQNLFEIFTGGFESISKSLTGWKLEVFLCANKIKNINFKIEELNEFTPYFKTKFPNNNKIT